MTCRNKKLRTVKNTESNSTKISEKDFKILVNQLHPDGWINKENSKKQTPCDEQIEAVRKHLADVNMLDKKKLYMQEMIERLRPEVEYRNSRVSIYE